MLLTTGLKDHMSNKSNYHYRHPPVISRDETAFERQDDVSNSHWYDLFIENLQKHSVQSQRTQRSIQDEIAAIMGNPSPKFSSVEEVVQDLRERTGLQAFINSKRASLKEPEIFSKIPQMKVFIDNFVEDRPGTSVASVIHDLMKFPDIRAKLPDATDVSDDVKAYINAKIAEISGRSSDRNQVDNNIGRAEQSTEYLTDDPLAICEPLKNKM